MLNFTAQEEPDSALTGREVCDVRKEVEDEHNCERDGGEALHRSHRVLSGICQIEVR